MHTGCPPFYHIKKPLFYPFFDFSGIEGRELYKKKIKKRQNRYETTSPIKSYTSDPVILMVHIDPSVTGMLEMMFVIPSTSGA